MRGETSGQGGAFSYVSLEERVPSGHPLRSIRRMTDEVFEKLSPAFDELYSKTGRPSIPPERLLRALLLQVLYTVRSERMLMEQLDYNPERVNKFETPGGSHLVSSLRRDGVCGGCEKPGFWG